MNFQRQVSNALDNEHRASLELLGRIEQHFVRAPRASAGADPDFVRLASAFVSLMEQDIGRHFDFEENEMFTRMIEAGEGGIASLLRQEHDTMREVAAEILPLARAAAAGGLDADGYQQLKVGALEMVERQVSHIQKETMALLPMLDDLLDEQTDRELAFAYASA